MNKERDTSETTRRAIRKASLDLIFEKGFDAMSMRDLAKRVGMQPASLYNYIHEKKDLLFLLLRDTLTERMVEVRERIQEVGDDPIAQIRVFVAQTVEFHTVRRREMTIGHEQIKRLSKSDFRIIVDIRDQFEDALHEAITRGCEQGKLHSANPRLATFAIISMITGVSRWYRPDGMLSSEQIGRYYEDMALALLGFGSEAQ